MLNHIKHTAKNRAPNVLAIETAVVDLQYPANGGDDDLKHAFFAHLKELISGNGGIVTFTDNPRPGDMALVMAEDFDDALISFANQHSLLPVMLPLQSKSVVAADIRYKLFGTPIISAGGSLANTFHAMVNSRIDNHNIISGHFTTAVGQNDTGQPFIDSLNGHIHYNRAGRQMECHVVPLDGDRIMISTPSKTDPAEAYIKSSLFAHNDGTLQQRDRIMIGGFLYFTPGFHDIYDSVFEHLKTLPHGQRPTLVLTAAAQMIAATPDFQQKIKTAITLTNVVVHANTGEFRRALDMDTTWRTPFDHDFKGLRGKDLDRAKSKHSAYLAAKSTANKTAISAAQDLCAETLRSHKNKLVFVATNGGYETYVIDANSCHIFTPNKINKEDIVNTVGAGDNFAAGFQIGDIHQAPYHVSAKIGADFAAEIIQSPDARISKDRVSVINHGPNSFRLSGPIATLRDDTLRSMLKKPQARTNTPKP